MKDSKQQKRTHTFSNGKTVTIQPVSAALAYALQENVPGKPDMPKPPVVNVAPPGEPREMEPNPDHPYFKWQLDQYEKDMAAWQQKGQMQSMRFILDKGVIDEPPDGWEAYVVDYVNTDEPLTKPVIKYYWLLSFMVDPSEMESFAEKLISQTMPTEKGIGDSLEIFHADGERDTASESVPDAE